MTGFAAAATSACVAALAPRSLRAQSHTRPDAPAVALAWRAPAGCPDEAAARARLAQLLHRATDAQDAAADRGAVVTVAPRPRGGYEAHVATRTPDGAGERTVTDARCDALADAALMVVAVALDPSLAGVADAPPTPPPAPPPPPPARPPAAPPRPAPGAPPPRRLAPPPSRAVPVALVARVMATGSLGVVPAVTPGVALAGGVALGRVRFELSATHWFAQFARSPGDAGQMAGGWISVTTGGAWACVLPLAARAVELGLCGGAEAGVVLGQGVDPSPRETGVAPWFAPGAHAWLGVALRPWLTLRAELGGGVPVTRVVFVLDGEQLFASGPFARGGLGLEVHFPSRSGAPPAIPAAR